MKKILLIALILGVFGATTGAYLYHKPASKTVGGQAAFAVNAAALFSEFELNEEAANQKYLNKVLQVNGLIADIAPADSQGVTVMLATNHAMSGISCQIADPAAAKDLKPGDRVQVKGLCTGMLMDVVLTKCSIEKSAE